MACPSGRRHEGDGREIRREPASICGGKLSVDDLGMRLFGINVRYGHDENIPNGLSAGKDSHPGCIRKAEEKALDGPGRGTDVY
jgi:hypothetical protein